MSAETEIQSETNPNVAAVEALRAASTLLLGTPQARVFFPKKERGESQPIRLEGYVTTTDLAALVHYIADMVEE